MECFHFGYETRIVTITGKILILTELHSDDKDYIPPMSIILALLNFKYFFKGVATNFHNLLSKANIYFIFFLCQALL